MKKNICYVLLIIQIFGFVNCKKDDLTLQRRSLSSNNTTVTIPDKINTAPRVNAGNDLFIYTIDNDTKLTGSYSDAENNVKEVKWTKISGPVAYRLANENSLSTKVDQLEKGVYQFELSVTDSLGLSGKDTVNINVSEIQQSPGEIIFPSRPWIFPWYSTVEVKNFLSIVVENQSFKVFIRRKNSSEWIPVPPVSSSNTTAEYEYFVETRPDGAGIYNYGSLYIFYYGKDVSDTPDVKITY
jgi:hypothetical protein